MDFARLVSHLIERVTGTNEDGGQKVFRDSAVDNLRDFFERFRSLNVRSNQQLDDLVAQAQRAVRNVGARERRDSDSLRSQMATKLTRTIGKLADSCPASIMTDVGTVAAVVSLLPRTIVIGLGTVTSLGSELVIVTSNAFVVSLLRVTEAVVASAPAASLSV